ncbi:hypothetical protein [Bradyrhizobium sp. CCBAU 53338]|uniref:DUF6894 family protein n=1 Tax=Bradyrhizobium sp. CCBAU 53338 TaxID=1325111 RepID=UPI00188BD331|nr:hypothetical protein [Bradyrhizobium sp. CCBAU 53338]QOZ54661.1 hypothetical protein XH90_27265 [Bradyrhizobium sp. CCBAU 53338]
MTVYFFDLRDEDALLLDEEGLEFSNLRDVQEEAAKSLADMARDAVHGAHHFSTRCMAIEVRDAAGPVMQVRFNFEVTRWQ